MRMYNWGTPKYQTPSSMLSECRWQSLWRSDLKLPCIIHYTVSTLKTLSKHSYFCRIYEGIYCNDYWEVLTTSLTVLMYSYRTSWEIILFHKKHIEIAENFVTKSSFAWNFQEKCSIALKLDILYLWLNLRLKTCFSTWKCSYWCYFLP